MMTPRNIALLYCLFAGLAAMLLATTMPPLQNADEEAHAFRADQVSHLVPWGQALPDGEYGGAVSVGLKVVENRTAMLRFHPERKVTRAMSAPLPWGAAAPTGFPNTAVNPPFFYAPAAAMAAFARGAGIALPRALVLMRLAEGLATILIAACAIALARDAAIWLFAIMLLPMSMALSAAVAQDGPMLACTTLAVALYLRVRVSQSGPAFAGMCLLLTMVGMARVPYFAFVFLVLASPVRPSWRILGALLMFACVAAWSARSAAHFPLPLRQDGVVSPGSQVLRLILHPWRAPLIFYRTLVANNGFIINSFIGQLGWLDVDLPGSYRKIAWIGLLFAAFASFRRGEPRGLTLEALAVAGAACGVGLIQYMTWTVVGSPLVDGVQGRYFLAPALVLAVLLTRGVGAGLPGARWVAAPVLLLPVFSIAVTVHALVLRYYF